MKDGQCLPMSGLWCISGERVQTLVKGRSVEGKSHCSVEYEPVIMWKMGNGRVQDRASVETLESNQGHEGLN